MKYKLNKKDKIIVGENILYRIVYQKDFMIGNSTVKVKSGSFGGYIDKTSYFEQNDNSYICPDSKVYNYSIVSFDSTIINTEIFMHIEIKQSAIVGAEIYNHVKVEKSIIKKSGIYKFVTITNSKITESFVEHFCNIFDNQLEHCVMTANKIIPNKIF